MELLLKDENLRPLLKDILVEIITEKKEELFKVLDED